MLKRNDWQKIFYDIFLILVLFLRAPEELVSAQSIEVNETKPISLNEPSNQTNRTIFDEIHQDNQLNSTCISTTYDHDSNRKSNTTQSDDLSSSESEISSPSTFSTSAEITNSTGLFQSNATKASNLLDSLTISPAVDFNLEESSPAITTVLKSSNSSVYTTLHDPDAISNTTSEETFLNVEYHILKLEDHEKEMERNDSKEIDYSVNKIFKENENVVPISPNDVENSSHLSFPSLYSSDVFLPNLTSFEILLLNTKDKPEKEVYSHPSLDKQQYEPRIYYQTVWSSPDDCCGNVGSKNLEISSPNRSKSWTSNETLINTSQFVTHSSSENITEPKYPDIQLPPELSKYDENAWRNATSETPLASNTFEESSTDSLKEDEVTSGRENKQSERNVDVSEPSLERPSISLSKGTIEQSNYEVYFSGVGVETSPSSIDPPTFRVNADADQLKNQTTEEHLKWDPLIFEIIQTDNRSFASSGGSVISIVENQSKDKKLCFNDSCYEDRFYEYKLDPPNENQEITVYNISQSKVSEFEPRQANSSSYDKANSPDLHDVKSNVTSEKNSSKTTIWFSADANPAVTDPSVIKISTFMSEIHASTLIPGSSNETKDMKPQDEGHEKTFSNTNAEAKHHNFISSNKSHEIIVSTESTKVTEIGTDSSSALPSTIPIIFENEYLHFSNESNFSTDLLSIKSSSEEIRSISTIKIKDSKDRLFYETTSLKSSAEIEKSKNPPSGKALDNSPRTPSKNSIFNDITKPNHLGFPIVKSDVAANFYSISATNQTSDSTKVEIGNATSSNAFSTSKLIPQSLSTEPTPTGHKSTEGRIIWNLCFSKTVAASNVQTLMTVGSNDRKVFWNLCPTKAPDVEDQAAVTAASPSSPITNSSFFLPIGYVPEPEVSTSTSAAATEPVQEETTQPTDSHQKEDWFPVYWNVPTFQCHKYGLNFSRVSEWGLRQNYQDDFRGQEIAILYDPGEFPALLPASGGGKVPRNGGVPQEGSLSRHLALFQQHLDKLIPDINFSGLAIIDFEHWRPVWRQNWGTLSPYRDFSRLIERRKHPFWFSTMVEVEASYRYELGARVFLLDTLKAGKRLRPWAKWGYYGYPFCFNYTPHNNRATCSYEVQLDNDSLFWLFSETTGYYPSLYLKNNDMYPLKRQRFIQGRLDEAIRVAQGVPVFPYVWYKYHDNDKFLTKEDMTNVLRLPMERGCSGAVIWGASRDVNSRERCHALLSYLDEVIGPAVKELRREYRTRGDSSSMTDFQPYLDPSEENSEEDPKVEVENHNSAEFEV